MFFATALLMAEDGAAAPAGVAAFFSPGIAMAVAAGLCGIGQGKAVSAACEGIARNPAAAGNIRTTLIIGLALIESLALYTLIVVLVKG
jgi:F-type H+-transporting ATPase subunit c